MLSIILALVVVGFALWLIGLIPMDARILMAIRGIVIFAVVLWLLAAFGLLPGGTRILR
jgi:hypothetical protein